VSTRRRRALGPVALLVGLLLAVVPLPRASDPGVPLLGRRTYELFAGFWPEAPADDPLAALLNGLPKYVASTTLREPLPWANAHVLRGDVGQAVGELNEQDGRDLRCSAAASRSGR
jgi:hypothetical protein